MSMNFKRNGNKLLNADIISPEMPYAIFSDGVIDDAKNKIISTLNHGGKIIEIYQQHRTNPHIENVVDMLKLIEDEYRKYDYERYASKRRDSHDR